jgi:hypothetical protein
MLAQEHDSGAWVDREDSPRSLDAGERRQADVQQDQIRLEGASLLDRVESVRGFARNLPTEIVPER